jgi:hypothetical protein
VRRSSSSPRPSSAINPSGYGFLCPSFSGWRNDGLKLLPRKRKRLEVFYLRPLSFIGIGKPQNNGLLMTLHRVMKLVFSGFLAWGEVYTSECEADGEGQNGPLVKPFHHKIGHLSGLTRNRLNGSKGRGGPPRPSFWWPRVRPPHPYLTPTSHLPPLWGGDVVGMVLFYVSSLKASG